MKPKQQHPQGSQGFTLIEVVVTVVILILGLLTILGVFLGAATANRHAQKVDIASLLAQQTIEEFQNMGYSQIQSITEQYGDIPEYPNHRRQVIVHDSGTLKEVQVIVHFDHDEHNARFRTFFTDI